MEKLGGRTGGSTFLRTLRFAAGLVSAALLFACGGGGGGATATPTPAGTTVSLTPLKSQLMGTAATGSQMTFNLTGSDSQKNAWSGTFTMVSDGPKSFEGQNVTSSRVTNTLTHTATGISASETVTFYFLTSNGSLYKEVSASGLTGTPVTQTQLPDTCKVGDTGAMWTTTQSDGTTETVTWRIDPDVNGDSRLVLTSVDKDSTNAVLSTEVDTFYLDANGNPTKYSVTVTDSGVTLTMTGSKM